MTSQTNPTADGRRTYEETVLVTPDLTVAVKVVSVDETTATGDRVTQLVTELFANSPASALGDKEYSFVEPVVCPLSFSFGGVDYSFVATFNPNRVSDENGANQAEVEHTLSHGLSTVYLGLISETLCFPGSSASDDVPTALLDALRSALSGSGAGLGSFGIVIGRGSSGPFGSGFPFGDPFREDDDYPGSRYGYPGSSMI